jgi:signal transduction histidine kinase
VSSADELGRLSASAARAAEEARAALRALGRAERRGADANPAVESRRRRAAARLAKLFASVLAENKSLRAEAAEAGEAMSNLMVKLSQDRRRWKAALLGVRRRLLAMRPPQAAAAGRVAALELELRESQDVAAGLMVEVARAQRGAKARLLGEERFRRRVRKQGVVGGAERARDAFADALDARLRALADSPSADPDQLVRAAEDARRLARGVALASVAMAPPRAERADARAIVQERLDAWEEGYRRRGAAVLRSLDPRWPLARLEAPAFAVVVDHLIASALDRAGRVGALVVKGGEAPGGLQIEFSDGGAPLEAGVIEDAKAQGGAGHPGLGLFLARVILRAWGGDLVAAPGLKGRGSRVTLTLSAGPKAK